VCEELRIFNLFLAQYKRGHGCTETRECLEEEILNVGRIAMSNVTQAVKMPYLQLRINFHRCVRVEQIQEWQISYPTGPRLTLFLTVQDLDQKVVFNGDSPGGMLLV
jgi:hypothetical protein